MESDFEKASDGGLILDGVNTYDGLALHGGGTYIMHRDFYCTDVEIREFCMLKTNGYRLHASGRIYDAERIVS